MQADSKDQLARDASGTRRLLQWRSREASAGLARSVVDLLWEASLIRPPSRRLLRSLRPAQNSSQTLKSDCTRSSRSEGRARWKQRVGDRWTSPTATGAARCHRGIRARLGDAVRVEQGGRVVGSGRRRDLRWRQTRSRRSRQEDSLSGRVDEAATSWAIRLCVLRRLPVDARRRCHSSPRTLRKVQDMTKGAERNLSDGHEVNCQPR